MRRIESIDMRFEGDINRSWTLHYSDGITENYYAYESSPRKEWTDERTWDTDPLLDSYLEAVSNVVLSYFDDDVICSSVTEITKIDPHGWVSMKNVTVRPLNFD